MKIDTYIETDITKDLADNFQDIIYIIIYKIKGICDIYSQYFSAKLDALKDTCFEIFKRWNGPHEYALGINPIICDSAEKGITHLICGELAGGNGRCWFSIAENREILLKTTKTKLGRMEEPPLYLSMDEILGEITVSKDGNKLTARVPKKHFAKESISISTDAEVLGHMEESHFWWYLDPI